MDDLQLLRIDKVLELVPISRSSLYRYVDQGRFPQPMKLEGVSLWRRSDIQAWQEREFAKARRRSDDI